MLPADKPVLKLAAQEVVAAQRGVLSVRNS